MSEPRTSQPRARKPFRLETRHGDVLHGTIDRANRPGRRPTVIICHGFKGFQEWCFLPYVAELMAARGYTVVRFNFSGTGMRPGDALVTDLEAFRRATLSRDLDELSWLVERLTEIDAEHVDATRLGLFGHSRGGGTSVLVAARSELRDRIAAVVTWAAVSTFDRATAEEKDLWRREGALPIVNARTGQQLQVGVELLDDVERNAARLDVAGAAAEVEAPWLIVHGGDDETVPAEEGRRLRASAGPRAEYLEVAGAAHTFGVGHPFAGPSRELVTAMNATQTFFRRHLD